MNDNENKKILKKRLLTKAEYKLIEDFFKEREDAEKKFVRSEVKEMQNQMAKAAGFERSLISVYTHLRRFRKKLLKQQTGEEKLAENKSILKCFTAFNKVWKDSRARCNREIKKYMNEEEKKRKELEKKIAKLEEEKRELLAQLRLYTKLRATVEELQELQKKYKF